MGLSLIRYDIDYMLAWGDRPGARPALRVS